MFTDDDKDCDEVKYLKSICEINSRSCGTDFRRICGKPATVIDDL